MSEDGATPEDEADDCDSGPFCRHWSDPSDCDEKCASCGHECHEHSQSEDDGECQIKDCPCVAWEERDE